MANQETKNKVYVKYFLSYCIRVIEVGVYELWPRDLENKKTRRTCDVPLLEVPTIKISDKTDQY
jgi:hypothetical protein